MNSENFGTELGQEDRLGISRRSDLRVRVLEIYLLFVGSVLIGAYIFYAVAIQRVESEIDRDDLAMAQAIARQVDALAPAGGDDNEALASWLSLIAADRDGIVLVADARGDLLLYRGAGVGRGNLWQGFLNRSARLARGDDRGYFESTDPDGSQWRHAFALSPTAGFRVVVQRPVQSISSGFQGFRQVFLISLIIYVAGGVVFWLVLSQRLITPLERLEAFSGLVRWRGRAHPHEEAHLRRLAGRADQVGSLSRSLMAMGEDIERRFVQLSTLLETSRIVASSLDVSEVMDNILEQVQLLFHVERCAIVALDQRAGVFRIRASRGLSERYVSQLRIDPSEPSSPSMRALRNKMPIQVSDTEADLAFATLRSRAHEEGYRSALALPLLTQHAPPAVLILYKSEPFRYSFSELELASSFANHATIAMENAALHAASDERLHEQTRRLEAIVESLADGLILEGLDGRVIYCNQRMAEMAELSRSQVQRSPPAELLERLLQSATDETEARRASEAAILGSGSRSFDVVRRHADGRSQDLRVHLFDVTDDRGDLIGRGQLWQDITSHKEVDRMKSALLSTVSHELRTPLAAIKGYATTLLARDVEWDLAAQREFLQTISDESDRLATLVKDLLDMSRIEAGTLKMECQHYSMVSLINQAIRQLRPPADTRLTTRVPDDLPLVWVDVSRIETVVRNLLENAIKYSPPEAPVELEALSQNGSVIVSVRDYGEGVPEALRDKVFDRFFRADNRLTRRTGGVGMGLAICKGFVEAHGGHIWVSGAQPGSVFAFSLPTGNDNRQEDTGR